MTSVKIGGIKYPIIKEKNLKDKKVPVWGMTKYEDSEICVNKDLGIQKQNQTIIHESLHAMLHEAGLDDYANDEKIVLTLGNIFYQFIKDNPRVVKQLTKKD